MDSIWSSCAKQQPERDNELNRLITTVNKSESLPVFGTSILIDTTFGICSGEFVTIAVGVSDSFRSKASGKMSSFVIGFMIHTVKSIESHELFAKALNERLYEYPPPNGYHQLYMMEKLLFVYTIRILKDATPLRCQIHRAKNLKTFFKNPAEFTLFKRDLFGETQQLPHGSLLTAGALNTLNFERYGKRMTKIIESCSSEELKNWLNRNLYDLFEFDSLYSRLKGGWFVHWLSTNLLEARNAHIKAVISSPVVAHQLITEFLSMHEDELKNRRGKSEVLVTPHIIENCDLLTLEERKIELCLLGLDDYLLDDEFSKFPQWVISADGKVESSMILKITNNLVVHPSSNDANVFFIESVEDSFSKYTISKVVRNVGELICFHFSCRKHRDYSYFFCVHCLSVFKTLIEPNKTECFHYLDNRRNGRTFVNLRFKTQAAIDGTKYSKRIGKQVSQGNHSRALQGIQRNSIDNILDGSYLDEEDDEDMFRFEN